MIQLFMCSIESQIFVITNLLIFCKFRHVWIFEGSFKILFVKFVYASNALKKCKLNRKLEAKIHSNFFNSSKIGQKCDYYCRRHGPLEEFVRFACHAQCKCPFCGDHWRRWWSELSAPKTRMCGEFHRSRQIRLAVSFLAKYIFVKLNFFIKRLIKTCLFIQYFFKIRKPLAENIF